MDIKSSRDIFPSSETFLLYSRSPIGFSRQRKGEVIFRVIWSRCYLATCSTSLIDLPLRHAAYLVSKANRTLLLAFFASLCTQKYFSSALRFVYLYREKKILVVYYKLLQCSSFFTRIYKLRFWEYRECAK